MNSIEPEGMVSRPSLVDRFPTMCIFSATGLDSGFDTFMRLIIRSLSCCIAMVVVWNEPLREILLGF